VVGDSPNDCDIVRVEGEWLGIRPTTVVSCVWRESGWGFAQRLWYRACGGRVVGDSPNDCGIVRVEGELLGIRPTTAYHCILSFDLDLAGPGRTRAHRARAAGLAGRRARSGAAWGTESCPTDAPTAHGPNRPGCYAPQFCSTGQANAQCARTRGRSGGGGVELDWVWRHD